MDETSFRFWTGLRRHAFFGFSPLVWAAYGAIRGGAPRRLLGALVVVGSILGFGGARLGGLQIPPTSALLYALHPLLGFLRIALRAHFLVALAVALAAAFGMAAALEVARRRGWPWRALWLGALALVLVENVPVPLRGFSARWAEAPAGYVQQLRDAGNAAALATVWDLPSDGGFDFRDAGHDLFPYNREILYMLWQTQHEQNSLGGVNGYVPPLRAQLDQLAPTLPAPQTLMILRRLGVTHLAFHPPLVLYPAEAIADALLASPELEVVHRSPETILLRLRDPAAESPP
jgi:hypothetical protein